MRRGNHRFRTTAKLLRNTKCTVKQSIILYNVSIKIICQMSYVICQMSACHNDINFANVTTFNIHVGNPNLAMTFKDPPKGDLTTPLLWRCHNIMMSWCHNVISSLSCCWSPVITTTCGAFKRRKRSWWNLASLGTGRSPCTVLHFVQWLIHVLSITLSCPINILSSTSSVCLLSHNVFIIWMFYK